jgi:hypothetical protein
MSKVTNKGVKTMEDFTNDSYGAIKEAAIEDKTHLIDTYVPGTTSGRIDGELLAEEIEAIEDESVEGLALYLSGDEADSSDILTVEEFEESCVAADAVYELVQLRKRLNGGIS